MSEATAKCRPILFNAEMVRAILAGKNSQTRRLMKPQPPNGDSPIAVEWFSPEVAKRGQLVPGPETFGTYGDSWHLKCPYGAPGDRLYVKETHAILTMMDGAEVCAYKATCEDGEFDYLNPCTGNVHRIKVEKWRPSIHMAKRASRIKLEITDIGVERLQEITRDDAIAEGITQWATSPENAYAALWEEINGAGSWAQNPWLWVVTFKRV